MNRRCGRPIIATASGAGIEQGIIDVLAPITRRNTLEEKAKANPASHRA